MVDLRDSADPVRSPFLLLVVERRDAWDLLMLRCDDDTFGFVDVP